MIIFKNVSGVLALSDCYGLRPIVVFDANINQEDKTCNVLGIKGEEDVFEERTAFIFDKSLLDIFDLYNKDIHKEYKYE